MKNKSNLQKLRDESFSRTTTIFFVLELTTLELSIVGKVGRTIGEIIQWLILMWETLDTEDMENKVEFI